MNQDGEEPARDDACYAGGMLRVRGRVQNGRLLVDEPSDLPDGSEIDLVAADAPPEEAPWPPELDAELAARHVGAQHGPVIDSEAFLAKLRSRRTA